MHFLSCFILFVSKLKKVSMVYIIKYIMQNTSYDNIKINIIDNIYQHLDLDLNSIFVEETYA